MKTIRLLILSVLIGSALSSIATNVTLSISGMVKQTPSMQPYPFHRVIVTVYPDSTNPSQTIIDSVYTNVSGLYALFVEVPWVPGTAVPFVVSTIDCQDYQFNQYYYYTGNSPQFAVNFEICSGSNPEPCDNYFDIAGMTGLNVSLWGHMVNQQAATYTWNFGDGTTGFGEYITHLFPAAGTYFVTLQTLTSDSCNGTSMQTVTVYDTVPSNLCDNFININDISGLTVSLYGGLYNQQNASYSWNFGDGTTGYGVSVTHTYPAQGTYSLSLTTITNDSCLDVTYHDISVQDSSYNCYSGFESSAGNAPHMIHFQGFTTSNYFTSYSWQFGDASTGTGQVIDHIYQFAGTYTVTLLTMNSQGCSYTYTGLVTVYDSLPNNTCDNYFSVYTTWLTAYFYAGLYNPIFQNNGTYTWDFGDGTTGNGYNISHTYPAFGSYPVTLTTVTSDSCVDVTTQLITLLDSTSGCNSSIYASATNTLYTIHFMGYSTSNYPSSYTWNFGDQTTGTGQEIDHTYSSPGTYLVTLVAVDTTGCSSSSSATVVVSMMGNIHLNGRVYADNQIISACNVQLFAQDPSGSLSLVQQSIPDSNNYYNFYNVASGIYWILANPVPGTIYYSLYLPTYYGDVFQWQNATSLVLGNASNPYDIHLATYDSIGSGSGGINGQINSGGKSILLANQEVLLLDMSGQVVRITYTDAMGNYAFEGLPFGDYQVFPNITGMTTNPVTVQLNSASPNASVNMKTNGNTITGLAEYSANSMIAEVYPNPVNSYLKIEMNASQGNSAEMRILDATGNIILTKYLEITLDKQLVTIPVSHLIKGLYIVQLIDNEGKISSQKFIKN